MHSDRQRPWGWRKPGSTTHSGCLRRTLWIGEVHSSFSFSPKSISQRSPGMKSSSFSGNMLLLQGHRMFSLYLFMVDLSVRKRLPGDSPLLSLSKPRHTFFKTHTKISLGNVFGSRSQHPQSSLTQITLFNLCLLVM